MAMLRDIMKTPNQAVLILDLVFGLWHYPVSHNISLVLLAAFTGAVYGSLRTIFEKTDDEIGIVSLTVSHWLFNIILYTLFFYRGASLFSPLLCPTNYGLTKGRK